MSLHHSLHLSYPSRSRMFACLCVYIFSQAEKSAFRGGHKEHLILSNNQQWAFDSCNCLYWFAMAYKLKARFPSRKTRNISFVHYSDCSILSFKMKIYAFHTSLRYRDCIFLRLVMKIEFFVYSSMEQQKWWGNTTEGSPKTIDFSSSEKQ